MTLIYQNFALAFQPINKTVVGERMALVDGVRAYLVEGKPYFGQIHFQKVSESWWVHETLQQHFKSKAALQRRIWAGTAGEVNLSYIAVSKAPAAILFDINPFQAFFWQQFFRMLANTPDPQLFAAKSRVFIRDLYFDLKGQFNLKAIRDDNPELLDMVSPDLKDHISPASDWFRKDHEESGYPIRNMTYKQFYNELRTHLGWKGTGSISCADKEVHWLANSEHYRHLHLLAKNNAIAMVTIDVADKPSCDQLKQALASVEYTPIIVNKNDRELKQSSRRGATIGNMYLSNVLYYLDYSEVEIAALFAKNERPTDFTGNKVSRKSYITALNNLRSLVQDDTAILRFDRVEKGLFGRPDYMPLFSVKIKEDIRIPKPDQRGGLVVSKKTNNNL